MRTTKICTKCLVEKAPQDFYTKGARIDSSCKECKKSARNKLYVSKIKEDVYETTKHLFRLYFEVESKKLDRIALRLQKLLDAKQKEGMQ